MKKTVLALMLVIITVFSCTTGCTANSSSTKTTNLAPISMKYGCINPAFQYFENSIDIACLTEIEKEPASKDFCTDFYSICDDVCTYVYQTYGIEIYMDTHIPIYVCNLEGYLGINGIAGLYDDHIDCIYIDEKLYQLDRTYYYRLLAHECCHMLQAHNAPNSRGVECLIEKDNKFLGYLLSEGICEKLSCDVTKWKSNTYVADISGYIDETYFVEMLEVSVPNLVKYFFSFDVEALEKDVNTLIYTNTTYNISENENITPFEHLLCHIDMCGNYRKYMYAGDNQAGSIYVYSAQSVIEMSCAMARNLCNDKKKTLWNILKEYDSVAFQNSMLRDYELLFKSVLFL